MTSCGLNNGPLEGQGMYPVRINGQKWGEFDGKVSVEDGIAALYFTFRGNGSLDFHSFSLF